VGPSYPGTALQSRYVDEPAVPQLPFEPLVTSLATVGLMVQFWYSWEAEFV